MEFRVLGPLEVLTSGGAVPLTGPKRRALLARFLVGAGETISAAMLADDLWAGNPPRSVTTTLQTFVYQLRRRYGIEALRTTPAGYVLDVESEQVDAHRFEMLTRAAIAGAPTDPVAAYRDLGQALALWSGSAYVEFADAEWAVAEAGRLDQLRVDAVEAWARCALGANEIAGVAAELEAWTTREPLRESLWALRLVTLAREGRAAEALRAATKLRAVLRDELGIDPSAPFSALETAILREEALPEWPHLGGFGFARGAVSSAVTAVTAATAPPAARSVQSRRLAPRIPSGSSARAPVGDLFVGRASELHTLERALETAGNGLPQIVVISGDAGIGKSRLLDEFTPHAVARGVQVLSGTCQEDVAVPYLPLAGALAALDPAGGNPFDFATTKGAAIAEDDRSRLSLYLATTRALLAAARERVTTLVVEDLHWADDATMSLLKHLLGVVVEQGVIERARLLVVLTTRPVASSTAVATLVSRLRRERQSVALDIRALTERECRDLITEWLGERPSAATMGRLFEATAGNPLVLRSALGRVGGNGDPITESGLVDLIGPTDLDRELWRRVEQVGDDCVEMLVAAAFLGDGGTLDLLAAASGLDAFALDDLIDEAGAHQVLVADDERYWFEHPQLRQLVYHWPASAERAARHLQLAERLGPTEADVRVIAHHLVRAGSLVDPVRMLAACGDAADRSASVGAWHDAAAYARAALGAAQALDLPHAERAAVRLRAGHTALLARDTARALVDLEAAADEARRCGAVETWGRALVHLARERVGTIELRAAATLSLASVDEFLDLGVGHAALRGEAHALAAELHFDLGDLIAAQRHNASAEHIALQEHDDELQVKVGFAQGLQHFGALELAEARDRFTAAAPRATTLSDPSPHIWCRSRLGLVAFASGDLEQAESLLVEAADASRDVDNLRELSMAAAFQAAVAAACGRFAHAETQAERALVAHRALPTPFSPGVALPALASARVHRGDADGAHRALDVWDALGGDRSRRYRPLVDAFAGDVAAARRALEHPAFRVFTTIASPNAFLTGAIAAQVELGALAGHPELVAGPLETLMELYDRGLRFAIGWPSFVPRVVALGLAATDRAYDARVWFDRALADAGTSGAAAERARTELDYEAFRDDGSGPSPPVLVERHAADDRVRSQRSSTRVILVTDLVGSTELNDRLGDREYVQHLRVHDEIVRHRLAECDGVEFKHTGDGIGAWFFSVRAALRCGTALAHDFVSAPAGPLRVKLAISAGEPTMVDRDLIGLAVTVAFRILELGRPGDVLVTSDVAGIARGLEWSFEPRGSHDLKGFHAPVDVLRAVSV